MSSDDTLGDLGAKDMEVLEAVHEAGGEAETGEVKELTGIDSNGVVLHKFDNLVECGLVELGTGESVGDRLPPKKAILTETAKEQIRAGLFAEDEPTIVERMDRLERQFDQVVKEVHELQGEIRRFRYDEERDEERDLQELIERVERFEERVAEVEGFGEFDPERVAEVEGLQNEIVQALEEIHGQVYQVAEAVHHYGIEPEGTLEGETGFAAQREDPVERLHETRR